MQLHDQDCSELNEFKYIFDKYYEQIRNFIYYKCGDIALAEDIAQDVFMKIWEKREDIRKETLVAFLYKIANNLYINVKKKEKLSLNFVNNTHFKNINFNTPEFEIEHKEFDQRLQHAISSLPEKCRLVFLMNRIDGLKYIEISDNLGITVKAIEKRMQKALIILRKKIGYKL